MMGAPAVSTTVADVVVPSGRTGSYSQQRTDESEHAVNALRKGHPKSKRCPIHPAMRR
jgi:hypothetical protein